MTKELCDSLGIDYRVKYIDRWQLKKAGIEEELSDFEGSILIRITFFSKKEPKTVKLLRRCSPYSLPLDVREIGIWINVDSLKEVLDGRDNIYYILWSIALSAKNKKAFYSVFDERKYTHFDYYKQYFKNALGLDLGIQLKLEFDFPLKFGDIYNAEDLEIRERALRKFGYERYIKEGIEQGHIRMIIEDDGKIIGYYPNYMGSKACFYVNSPNEISIDKDRERIIILEKGIAFLQVKDPSTGKTYFLKIPPNITDIQEAKAWTFGLSKEQYKPTIET